MGKNDAFLLFTLAYRLDWLIGDPKWAPHPVRWMGRLIQVGENFLRRFIRGSRADSGLGDAYIRLAVRSNEDNLRLVSLVETWLRRSAKE
jgi:cobalamin biosynthesis protein CobD/CbiB